MSDWFSAGLCGTGNIIREAFIRAWQPGDGLRCSAAGYQSTHQCDPPVAVVRRVFVPEESYSKHAKETIVRIYCLRHVVEHFTEDAGPRADDALEKQAVEMLAQKHWKEYQKIRATLLKTLLDERLSVLPADLRAKVIERIEANNSGAP